MHAIASGNYISILVWAIAMGAVLRQSHSSTREVLLDAAKTVEFIVRLVIRFAPFGIFGIVASTLATTGLEVFAGYLKLLAVLVGTMFFIALVVNPILVWLMIRRKPISLHADDVARIGRGGFLHAFVCGKISRLISKSAGG